MSIQQNITGLILAGGRAQRMGGMDKGLISFMGQPLIEHAFARLAPQVGPILINANRNHDRYEQYGYPVVADCEADFAGPLAGFSAGLARCETEYLVSVPCDSPLYPLDLVSRLLATLNTDQADLVYASSKDTSGAIWAQPVFCLMHRRTRESLARFLEQGGRKIDRWFSEVRSATVVFDDDSAFANTNTPDELSALERQLQFPR